MPLPVPKTVAAMPPQSEDSVSFPGFAVDPMRCSSKAVASKRHEGSTTSRRVEPGFMCFQLLPVLVREQLAQSHSSISGHDVVAVSSVAAQTSIAPPGSFCKRWRHGGVAGP